MIFGTKARRTDDSQQGREWDVAYGRPDTVSRWGPLCRGRGRGTSNLLGDRRLEAYKAPGDPPFAGASCSSCPACVSLRFSFAISAFPSCGWAT